MSYLISRPRIRAATLGALLLAGVAAPLCFLRAERETSRWGVSASGGGGGIEGPGGGSQPLGL